MSRWNPKIVDYRLLTPAQALQRGMTPGNNQGNNQGREGGKQGGDGGPQQGFGLDGVDDPSLDESTNSSNHRSNGNNGNGGNGHNGSNGGRSDRGADRGASPGFEVTVDVENPVRKFRFSTHSDLQVHVNRLFEGHTR